MVTQTFLVFNDLHGFEESRADILPNVSELVFIWRSVIRLELCVWGRKSIEIKCYFHHIKSPWYQHALTMDVNSDHLAKVHKNVFNYEFTPTQHHRVLSYFHQPLFYLSFPTVKHWLPINQYIYSFAQSCDAYKAVSKSLHQCYYRKQSAKLSSEVACMFGLLSFCIRNISSLSEIHKVVKILSFVFCLCSWCILPCKSVAVFYLVWIFKL